MGAIKVIFWGRGGEGVKTASHILAEASFLAGFEVQAFPEYGPERSGAPLRAFLKIAKDPIISQSPVTNPDFVFVIDSAFLKMPEMKEKILSGASKQTIFFINSQIKPDFKGKIINLDASGISIKHLKKDFANIVLLGAFLAETKLFDFKYLEQAVKEALAGKPELIEPNLKALKEAYSIVK